ncbi:MAG TPA: CPBP family intramembrane metalloprotease [Kouleothrix sp.]|nr:CPBP family intramembrane metalloprotease [Kouleothrix sp.]
MAQQYDAPFVPAPEPAPRPRKWPLAGVMEIDFVIALVAFVGLTLLVQIAFVGIRVAQQGLSLADLQARLRDQAEAVKLIGADGLFATLLATNAAFALIPIARVRWLRHEPLAEIGFQARNLPKLIAIGVGVGVLSLLANGLISGLFQRYGVVPDQSAQFPLFQGDYLGQALFMLGAAVLAPIGEEILFRGYVFNALRETFGQRRWGLPLAYGVSALLFAAVHVFSVSRGLLGLMLPLFVIGLLLAWAMHTTRSLLPCIIAHAINNGVALVALVICINNPGMAGCPAI